MTWSEHFVSCFLPTLLKRIIDQKITSNYKTDCLKYIFTSREHKFVRNYKIKKHHLLKNFETF